MKVCDKPGGGGSRYSGTKWNLDGHPIDAGNHVVATYRIHGRGRGSGVEVDQRPTLIWSVRNGKIARVQAYRERTEALEAAGLRE